MSRTIYRPILVSMKGLAILTLLIATPCLADTIYNNLGPGNTFIINREYDTPTSLLATPFVTTGAGALDTVLMSVFSLDSPIAFSLYADGNNAPGELLESWSVPVPGLPGELFTLNSVLNPMLAANTEYWFVITQAKPFQVAWYENNQGVPGGIYESFSLDGTYLQFVPNSPMPALQLNSTTGGSTGGTTTVPEPGSISLLGVSAIGLLFALSRRQKHLRAATTSQPIRQQP